MAAATRTVVVNLWTGTRVVARLGPAGDLDTLSDSEVLMRLRLVGVAIPATAEARRARLAEWPTQADLDEIATAWTAANDGVRPVARVLEQAPNLRRHTLGPPGSLPAGTVR